MNLGYGFHSERQVFTWEMFLYNMFVIRKSL